MTAFCRTKRSLQLVAFYREFILAQNERLRLAMIYLDGLVDKAQVSDQIMKALALEVAMALPGQEITKARALEFIKQRGLCVHQIEETCKLQDVIHAILSGDTALLVDGHAVAVISAARGWESRAITEPEAEPTVRGARESFVETLRVNTSLIRRRIKSPHLKIEALRLGEVTATDVAVVYIEGIVTCARCALRGSLPLPAGPPDRRGLKGRGHAGTLVGHVFPPQANRKTGPEKAGAGPKTGPPENLWKG